MTTGTLIVVTGPAAVGKSTLAKALQSELTLSGELWLVMELDVFARALSRDWIAWGKHRGRYAELGFEYARASEGSIELTLGSDGRRVLAAFHRSVAAVVKSGVHVICESIVHDDQDWRDWSEALTDIPACWVKLKAPLAILEDRENAERAAASKGLARGMSARKPVGIWSVEADTDAETTAAIVHRIIHSLRV